MARSNKLSGPAQPKLSTSTFLTLTRSVYERKQRRIQRRRKNERKQSVGGTMAVAGGDRRGLRRVDTVTVANASPSDSLEVRALPRTIRPPSLLPPPSTLERTIWRRNPRTNWDALSCSVGGTSVYFCWTESQGVEPYSQINNAIFIVSLGILVCYY